MITDHIWIYFNLFWINFLLFHFASNVPSPYVYNKHIGIEEISSWLDRLPIYSHISVWSRLENENLFLVWFSDKFKWNQNDLLRVCSNIFVRRKTNCVVCVCERWFFLSVHVDFTFNVNFSRAPPVHTKRRTFSFVFFFRMGENCLYLYFYHQGNSRLHVSDRIVNGQFPSTTLPQIVAIRVRQSWQRSIDSWKLQNIFYFID